MCYTFVCVNQKRNGTVIERKQTAFRLSIDLLERLKEAATQENRSLNNYIESVLMNVVYNRPNKITLKAMQEARINDSLNTIDSDKLY